MKIIPSTRRSRSICTYSASATVEPRMLQRIVASPAFVACVSIAWASAGKIGLASSGTSSPIAPVLTAPGGT